MIASFIVLREGLYNAIINSVLPATPGHVSLAYRYLKRQTVAPEVWSPCSYACLRITLSITPSLLESRLDEIYALSFITNFIEVAVMVS
jgi:hypothetical protein